MWFNNLRVYQYELDENINLHQCLTEHILKTCPAHARFIYGWTPVFSDELIQEVAKVSFICMGKEERVLPRGVINKLLAEKIQILETQQGRTIKRVEKAQMAEDIEFELLPKSFCIQKRLFAILDSHSHQLLINTASDNQALQLIGLLRKSIPGIKIEPLTQNENIAQQFAQWIQSPITIPPSLQLASDCILFATDNEKKRIHCKGYELPADEVSTLLKQGMLTSEISLIWKERIQFTLTQDFTFKKHKSLDYLIDAFDEIKQLDAEIEQQDAALTLLAGELRELVEDLHEIFSSKSHALEAAEA